MSEMMPWEEAAQSSQVPQSAPADIPPWEEAKQLQQPSVSNEPDTSNLKDYMRKMTFDSLMKKNGVDSIFTPGAASGPLSAFEAGVQNSVAGLQQRKPVVTMPEDASRMMKIMSSVGQFAGDLPYMAAGSAAGGLSGAFAVPAALRKILMDHYEKGDITSAEDFANRTAGAAIEAYKGALTGEIAGVGGKLGAAAGELSPIAQSIVKPLASIGGETVAMTTAAAALEGHLPNADDFTNAAIVMGGLHGAGTVVPKLRNMFANTGDSPIAIADEADKDAILKQQILTEDKNSPPQATPTEIKHYSNENIKKIYHGTNTNFEDFDFDRGGGMVHFAEDQNHAQKYSMDIGSGGRKNLSYDEVKLIENNGQNNHKEYAWDPREVGWKATDGSFISTEEYDHDQESGDPELTTVPTGSRIISKQIDMNQVLDTTTPEGLKTLINTVKPTNRRIARFLREAKDELDGKPGSVGFGNSFWSITKLAKGDEINSNLKDMTEQLKAAGYKGIRFKDDNHPTVAAFDNAFSEDSYVPEQQWKLIPKTVEQPTEPPQAPERTDFEKRVIDTIVNRPEAAKTPFMKMLSKGIDALAIAIKDDLSPIKNISDEAQDNGHLDPSKNPYMLARLYKDVSGKILTAFSFKTTDFNSPTKFTGEGLNPILRDVPNQDFEMLDAYLKANRFIEDPAQRKQGISLEDAKSLVEKNKEQFEPIAKRLYAFQDRMKDYAVDSGILSKDKSDLFDQKSKNYAPLYKLLDVDPLTEERKGGASLFKKMFGSDNKSISSIQGIFENTAAIIKAAEKNRVFLAMTDLPGLEENDWGRKIPAEVNGIKVSAEELEKANFNDYKNQILKHIPDASLEDIKSSYDGENVPAFNDLTVYRRAPVRLAENEIAGKRDGKPEVWAFRQDIATAMKTMDYQPQFTSLWAKMFTKPFELATKSLRTGVTATPGFALFHGYRSAAIADIQTKYPGVPLAGIVDAIGEQLGHSEEYWKTVASGAVNTDIGKVSEFLNGKNWGHDADTLLKESSKWVDGDPLYKNAWNAIFTPLRASEILTQLTDNAPRVREFKKGGGLDGNLDQQIQAAYDAREVSVDYKKHGALTKLVSFAQPFLNVDMQGTFRAIDNLKDPKVIAKALALITLPEIINFALNKDDERYKQEPLWSHGVFLNIPFNDWRSATADEYSKTQEQWMKRQNQDGSYEINHGSMVKIPRAFTMGFVFGSIPQMIMSRVFNENPRAFDNITEQITKSIMPMGMTTLLEPIIEQKTNHNNFTGDQLVPSYLEKELPEYQFNQYTSELAKQLGRIVGYLPQIGPKDAQLASPMVIDNYIRRWGGGVGQYVVAMTDRALSLNKNIPSQPEKDWTDYPEVRRFFSHFPSSKAQSIEDFRANFNEIDRTANTIKSLAQDYQRTKNKSDISDYSDLLSNYNSAIHDQMKVVNNGISAGGIVIRNIQLNT